MVKHDDGHSSNYRGGFVFRSHILLGCEYGNLFKMVDIKLCVYFLMELPLDFHVHVCIINNHFSITQPRCLLSITGS